MSDLLAQVFDNPAVAAAIWALGAGLVALWIAGAWWAYADALRRTDHQLAGFVAAGWILLSTPLLLPFSLAVYGFARPHAVAGERRVRTLMEELGAVAEEARCASCGVNVDLEWLRCPTCAHWLASPCAHCGRWSDASLELCPWCGGEERAIPFVRDVDPVSVPVAVGPGFAPPALVPAYAAAASTADGLDEAHALNDRLSAARPLDADETAPAAGSDPRRFRLAWRAGGPTVPLAQRRENRRLAVTPDARRAGRTTRVQRA